MVQMFSNEEWLIFGATIVKCAVFTFILFLLIEAISKYIKAKREYLKEKKNAKIRTSYAVDEDSLYYQAQRAINDKKLRGFIEEVNANGKDYYIGVEMLGDGDDE